MGSIFKARIPVTETKTIAAMLANLQKNKATISTSTAGEWVRGNSMRWEGGAYHSELLGYMQFTYIEAVVPTPKRKRVYVRYCKGPRDAMNLCEGGRAYTREPIMRFRNGDNS